MTDLEISKRLALAIGWKDCNIDPDVITIRGAYDPEPEIHCWHSGNWHRFDYRDWNVAGPIAAKYGLVVNFHNNEVYNECWFKADTPQKAIALAVIGAMK